MLASVYGAEAPEGYEPGYLDKFYAGAGNVIYVAEAGVAEEKEQKVIGYISVEYHAGGARPKAGAGGVSEANGTGAGAGVGGRGRGESGEGSESDGGGDDGDGEAGAKGGAFAYLDDFCVEDALRGRGIGTELLKAAEAHAKEAGAGVIRLHAEKTNEGAIRLYRRNGYEVEGEDGTRYLMKKEISG